MLAAIPGNSAPASTPEGTAAAPLDHWASGDLTGDQLTALLPPVTTTILVSMFAPVAPEWLVGDLHSEGYSVEFREAESLDECRIEAADLPLTDPVSGRYDRNLVAQFVHTLFACSARVGGLGDAAPTRSRRWDAVAEWGFGSMAEQVAAEAVVVAYCETEGFDPRALTRNNPWGYGGLFQMGSSEMRRFGGAGASKFDPLDNGVAAAAYFLLQARAGDGWGGWGPWAVVNTNFDDEVNNKVRIPVLPRFRSTDPEFAGRRGPELPAWAVDPWSWEVPGWGGCPYTGGRWAEAAPLTP